MRSKVLVSCLDLFLVVSFIGIGLALSAGAVVSPAAGLAILLMGFSLQKVSNDPCGGNYVGEPLRAVFPSQYIESDTTYNCTISNDNPGYYCQYQKPGGDCAFLFRAGHIVVGVDKTRNGRYVNMQFIGDKLNPGGSSCGTAYFIDGTGEDVVKTSGFTFRTTGGFEGSRDENNDHENVLP
jgi:hypothetical protein